MTNTPPVRPELGLVEWLRHGEEDRVEALIRDMKRLGIRHLRTGISWADAYADGGWDWIDFLLGRLGEEPEIEVLPCVTYTPPSIGIEARTASPPRDTKAYADFLDVLVTRHGHAFDWIELWNEPNNLNDWDFRIDHEWRLFADMIGKAAFWMKERGKKTVLGGMCPTDPNWLRLMADAGVLAHIAAVALHGFPGTWTHDGLSWRDHVRACREAVAGPGNRVEFWITEAGYSTWRHDERGQVSILLDMLDAPVQRAYWYAWQDLDERLASQEGFHVDERHYHFGLVRTDGRDKLLARLLAKGGVAEARRVAALAVPAVATSDAAAARLAAPAVTGTARTTVVTGGAGFLGVNLADALAAEGRHVLIYDSLARPGVEANLAWLRDRHGARVEAVCGDIRDRWSVREALADAATVFHLAAQVAVTTSVAYPREDFDVNLGGAMNVLEAARRAQARRGEAPALVFASTNKVYGHLSGLRVKDVGPAYAPVDKTVRAHGVAEDTPLDLCSPYGCSKGGADQYVLDHARIYGLPATVFRMSCLYGPRQFGTEDQGWLAHFLISVLNGAPITIYGDGKQVRDVLYVDDVVRAYRLAERHMAALSGTPFNIGGGPSHAVSLRQALDLIEGVTGRVPNVSYGPWRPGDQPYYVSDTRTFQALTGWRPETAVEDGLVALRDLLAEAGVAAPPAAHILPLAANAGTTKRMAG